MGSIVVIISELIRTVLLSEMTGAGQYLGLIRSGVHEGVCFPPYQIITSQLNSYLIQLCI